MADDIAITIRTRGGKQSAREARDVSTAIGSIAPAARRAAAGVGSLGRESVRAGQRGFGILRNQAQYAGLAIGGIGAFAVKSGLQFNATMEQNEIAFTQFLGSAQAAKQELADLYQIAKTTPFEFADVTMATRKFLAFGFSAKQSNALLRTVADTASGLALDSGGIDRMVLAIGQIRSKGTLQAEDLRQLQELGAVDVSKLAKDLGLTREEMANVGKEHVPATKALAALKSQWDKTFGGMSAKQAKTFSGQMSTLRDNTNQLLGTITKPAFNKLRNDVLPALNDLSGELGRTWGKKGPQTTEMKLFQSRMQIQKALKPLEDEVGKMHLGAKFGDAVDAAAPEIGRAFGRAAPHAAGAFADAWLHSGKWVQLGSIAFVGLKLASFVARGAAMGRGFRLGWGAGVGTLPAPVGPPGVPGKKPKVPGKGPGVLGRIGSAARWGLKSAEAVGLGVGFWDVAHGKVPRWVPGWGGTGLAEPAFGGGKAHSRKSVPAPRTRVPRLPAHGGSHGITVVQIDGKTVARAVHRHANDARANRRGG